MLLCTVLLSGVQFGGTAASAAAPPVSPTKVPVLIIDGGMGDDHFYATHWLGVTEEVAAGGGLRLVTGSAPTWWGGTGCPDTYILSGSDGSGSPASMPIGVAEIAWGIDRVTERHPEGKVVLVAQGASGLQARKYLEDFGDPKQTARADVLGLVLLGSPNGGTEMRTAYPDMSAWQPFAAGAGLQADDLMPGSALLTELDSGRLPSVVKTLVVQGVVVKLADTETDGIVTRAGSTLATGVAVGPVDSVVVKARASESFALRDSWFPYTKGGGTLLNAVDDDEVERLAPSSGYSTLPDVRAAVKTYYETWFSGEVPVTHISTRLVVDISGSMAEDLGGVTKLDAAKRAAGDFVVALADRQALSVTVPEDVGLVAFNEKVNLASASGVKPDKVKSAVAALKAGGNTDVGAALTAAIKSFDASPKTADTVIVFLSDGINTVGLKPQQILDGPVKDASKRGIRIETIALGGVESADQEFLKKVSTATGGTFHSAKDQYELRRDFLRARFASLGELVVDAAAPNGVTGEVVLGDMAEGTRVLEFTIVSDGKAPEWNLTRNGEAIDMTNVVVSSSADGLVVGTIHSPPAGTYAVQITKANGSTKAHVFAVRQIDAFRSTATATTQEDDALILLIGLGGAVFLAVVVTMVLSRRSRRGRKRATDEIDDAEAPADEETGE